MKPLKGFSVTDETPLETDLTQLMTPTEDPLPQVPNAYPSPTLTAFQAIKKNLVAALFDADSNGFEFQPKETIVKGGITEQDAELLELTQGVEQYTAFLEDERYQASQIMEGMTSVIRRLDGGWMPSFTPDSNQPHENGFWFKQDRTNRDVTGVCKMTGDEYWAFKAAMNDPEG